jgi:hypothetical protein
MDRTKISVIAETNRDALWSQEVIYGPRTKMPQSGVIENSDDG